MTVGENPLNRNSIPLTGCAEGENIVYSMWKHIDVLIVIIKCMKKFDKEYSTQYTPEMEFLKERGIPPSFVKVINNVTTYKYTKTSMLFETLAIFYK